jgi:hypothetical protein
MRISLLAMDGVTYVAHVSTPHMWTHVASTTCVVCGREVALEDILRGDATSFRVAGVRANGMELGHLSCYDS